MEEFADQGREGGKKKKSPPVRPERERSRFVRPGGGDPPLVRQSHKCETKRARSREPSADGCVTCPSRLPPSSKSFWGPRGPCRLKSGSTWNPDPSKTPLGPVQGPPKWGVTATTPPPIWTSFSLKSSDRWALGRPDSRSVQVPPRTWQWEAPCRRGSRRAPTVDNGSHPRTPQDGEASSSTGWPPPATSLAAAPLPTCSPLAPRGR